MDPENPEVVVDDKVEGAIDEVVVADPPIDGADPKPDPKPDEKIVENKEAPKTMQEAIDIGLGYKKGPNGEKLDVKTGLPVDDKGKPIVEKPAAAVDKHANGTPKKDAKGNELDDKGAITKAAPAKPLKTSTDLALRPDEAKALSANTRIRFGELVNTLKAHEAQAAKTKEVVESLTAGRDAIMGLMQETGTNSEALSGYLYFNKLVNSQDPKELESALEILENQRRDLYAKLGREPQGGDIDLLAAHADLKKEVDEEMISRERALEIARHRDANARQQKTGEKTKQAQANQEAQKKATDDALDSIEAWTNGLGAQDIDFKAKEATLLDHVDAVIKEYPPAQWLPTLKLLYSGIKITKQAAAPGNGQPKPLRPSSVRAGHAAPKSMKDAIDIGLGYKQAEAG